MNSSKFIGIVLIAVLVIGLGVYLSMDKNKQDEVAQNQFNVTGSPDSNEVSEETTGTTGTTGPSIAPSTTTTAPATQTTGSETGGTRVLGSYEVYAPEKVSTAGDKDVVLFFKASWCPSCRALDASIKANSAQIPANVMILEVDYDRATALRQKYGVTSQHTLVQVDASGNQVAKWTGSQNVADIVSKIQ